VKVKKVKIGIKSIEEVLRDTGEVMKKIERGEKVKPVKEPEVYFTSFEAFRKALTPKRLELLRLIKTKNPSSINELARIAKRDVKNITDDVKYLAQIGLIVKKETNRKTTPVIPYDKLLLEIAV
jgi:predicted transcriptional regulator